MAYRTVNVEVSDTRTERVPPLSAYEPPDDAESGRGLLLVSRPATRWGAGPPPGRTGQNRLGRIEPSLTATGRP